MRLGDEGRRILDGVEKAEEAGEKGLTKGQIHLLFLGEFATDEVTPERVDQVIENLIENGKLRIRTTYLIRKDLPGGDIKAAAGLVIEVE